MCIRDRDLDEYGRVKNLSSQDEIKPDQAPTDSQADWYAKNKNSNNETDKAIVNWLQSYDRNLGLRAWYNPDEDIAFQKTILPLGIKKLPEILERANTDETWNGFMMLAFAKISKIKDLEEVSLSDEGKAKWFQTLKNKAIAAKALNDNQSADAKQVITKERLTKDVADLGVLLLPYLSSQAKSGNQDAMNNISVVTDAGLGKSTNNSQDIENINNLIETIINKY
jgi:hypothetical protein